MADGIGIAVQERHARVVGRKVNVTREKLGKVAITNIQLIKQVSRLAEKPSAYFELDDVAASILLSEVSQLLLLIAQLVNFALDVNKDASAQLSDLVESRQVKLSIVFAPFLLLQVELHAKLRGDLG